MDNLLTDIEQTIKNYLIQNKNETNIKFIPESELFLNNDVISIELDRIEIIRWVKKIFINIYPDIKFSFGSPTINYYKYCKNNNLRIVSNTNSLFGIFTNYNFIIEITWNNVQLNADNNYASSDFNIMIINLDNGKKISFNSIVDWCSGTYYYYLRDENCNNKISCRIFRDSKLIDTDLKNNSEFRGIVGVFSIRLNTLVLYKINHPIMYFNHILNNYSYSEIIQYISKIDRIKMEEQRQKLIIEENKNIVLNDRINKLEEQNNKLLKDSNDLINLGIKIKQMENTIRELTNNNEQNDKTILNLTDKNNDLLNMINKYEEANNNKTITITELENKIIQISSSLSNCQNNFNNLKEKYDSMMTDVIEKDLMIKKQNIKLNEINGLYEKLQEKFINL